jgi:hypothetical protein
MNKRILAGAAALLVFVALVVVAVTVGDDGSSEPKALPIGAGAGGAASNRDAAMSMPVEGGPGFGGIEYRIGSLPDLPDEADAFTLEPAVADVDRIADVLGVDRKDVHAERSGGAPWSVYLDQPVASSGSGYACPENAICDPPPDYEEPQRPEGMPTREEARAFGTKLLERLGVELDGASVRVEDGFSQWLVLVDPRVDGHPTTGMTTAIGIGPNNKVISANGWTADPERGDTYPLIGVREAAKRLTEQQPRIMAGLAEDTLVAPAPDCVDCPEPEPTIVTITGARLGLQLYGGYEVNGPAYLVPSYLFTTDQPDSGELAVIAVEDKYLAPPPAPPASDEPGVTEPGGGGTEPAPPSRANGCTTTEADGVFVQLCGPGTARVGENVQFQLIAKGKVRDDCGSPVPDYGDGEEVAVCAIGCESLPEEPRGIERTFEHTYAKAGSFEATFTLMGCGSDVPQASVSIGVRVEE